MSSTASGTSACEPVVVELVLTQILRTDLLEGRSAGHDLLILRKTEGQAGAGLEGTDGR